jgi:NAD(P)-dependent dehydrogenase (short-subunit alcohol dehydrogenase family)
VERLKGRVAVVTGAASGIGRALALRSAAEGMNVVLADVEAGALAAAATAVEAEGALALPVVTDVSQPDSVAALAERAVERFGAVHLLCNNAGVFTGGVTWESPISDYDWVLGVNVMGVIHGIRSFAPILLAQDEGHIVNTASMAALVCTPFTAAYSMSKAAVLSLSETLYLEMQAKQANVGVSALCPELIHTRIDSSQRNRPAHLKRPESDHPERDLVETAIASSIAGGLPPEAMAERVFEAVREGRLYVLAPEGDPWRDSCHRRLDDIRAARNPSMASGIGE